MLNCSEAYVKGLSRVSSCNCRVAQLRVTVAHRSPGWVGGPFSGGTKGLLRGVELLLARFLGDTVGHRRVSYREGNRVVLSPMGARWTPTRSRARVLWSGRRTQEAYAVFTEAGRVAPIEHPYPSCDTARGPLCWGTPEMVGVGCKPSRIGG
jgi:hypothetical protein